jgi:Uncharacterized protein conserved in bacteria
MTTEVSFDMNEVLDEVRDFLPRLLEAGDSVASMLYNPAGHNFWPLFGDLVQGMDDLYRTMQTVLRRLREDGDHALLAEPVEQFVADLARRFGELNRYMDDEAYSDAGDCIRYDLQPLFAQLAAVLGEKEEIRRQRLQSNLAWLKERFPRAYAQLQHAERDLTRYILIPSRNGSMNVAVRTAEGKDVYFYSRYEPESEAARWVEVHAAELGGKSNVILYGFGLGYHAAELTRTYPDLNLHIYEPDLQLLLAAMETIDLKALLDRPQVKDFVVGKDKDHRDGLFYRFMKYAKGETATLSIPNYDKLDAEWKRAFVEDAKMAIQNYVSHENMYDKFGLEWTRNALYNMAYNITTPPITGLKGKLAGVPAVIVGAGPSLERDIETLRKLKRHALIIAAGSSIRALKHFGIDPHLIVSMDGGYANYAVFQNMEIQDIPLLYVPQVEYRVIDGTSRHLFHVFFNTDYITMYLMGLGADDPVFRSSHSVTGTAIQAAVWMGCSEVILAGQDLSYPVDQIYAEGSLYAEEHKRDVLSRAVLQVENVAGGYNRTTQSMLLTLRDIEEIIAMFPQTKFTNTSKHGAKINRTGWEDMESVLNRLGRTDVPERVMIDAMVEHLSLYPEARRQALTHRLVSLPSQLEEFERAIQHVRRNLARLPELSRKKPDKCVNTMFAIEKDWGQAVQSIVFNTFFNVLLKREISHFDRELPEVAGETNLIRKADLFVEVVGRLARAIEEKIPHVRDMVRHAIERLESRIQINASGDGHHV